MFSNGSGSVTTQNIWHFTCQYTVGLRSPHFFLLHSISKQLCANALHTCNFEEKCRVYNMFCINWLRLTNSWQKFMDDLFRMQQSNNRNASKTNPLCSASYSVNCASPWSPLDPATQRAKNGFTIIKITTVISIYIFMYYHLSLNDVNVNHHFNGSWLPACKLLGLRIHRSPQLEALVACPWQWCFNGV